MSGANGAVRKTLATTIRSTQDIWFTKDPSTGDTLLRLFPGAALHLVDHHLHASGILPRVFRAEAPSRLYEHDWFCVSQAVTCFPYEGLLELSVEDLGSEPLAHTHIWVTKVGNSSLHLGQIITLDDQVLAAARRVFVRRLGKNSAPFSEVEKYHFENECAPDEYILGLEDILLRLNAAVMTPTPPPSLSSDGSPLPRLETFGTFLPKLEGSPILKTVIGPQHTNFGNHADHACLAEIALQALQLGKAQEEKLANQPYTSIAINYIAEAFLGQELECHLHDDRVFLVRPLPIVPTTSDSERPTTAATTTKSTTKMGMPHQTPTRGRLRNGKTPVGNKTASATATASKLKVIGTKETEKLEDTSRAKQTRQLILVAKLHR